MRYDFSLLEEIFESIPDDAVDLAVKEITSHKRVFVHGLGRSGLMMKALAMRLAQAGYTAFVVGDATTPAITSEDLIFIASASGKTPGALRAAEISRSVGACVFAFTASKTSDLAAISDNTVLLQAPTKDSPDGRSIMGSLFEEALLLFIDTTVASLGIPADELRKRHANLE